MDDRLRNHTNLHLHQLVACIKSCGVSFNVWESVSSSGNFAWTSLTGESVKKVLKLHMHTMYKHCIPSSSTYTSYFRPKRKLSLCQVHCCQLLLNCGRYMQGGGWGWGWIEVSILNVKTGFWRVVHYDIQWVTTIKCCRWHSSEGVLSGTPNNAVILCIYIYYIEQEMGWTILEHQRGWSPTQACNSIHSCHGVSCSELHGSMKLLLQQPVGCPSRRQSTGWKSCVSMPEKGGLTLSIILHTGMKEGLRPIGLKLGKHTYIKWTLPRHS